MKKNRTFKESLHNAFTGLRIMLSGERNVKIEAGIGFLALAMCAFMEVKPLEWVIIIICCMVVLSLECVNSAIEQLVDLVSPEYHILAKRAKDFAAGAVLFASICSAIVGIIVFLPYWM